MINSGVESIRLAPTVNEQRHDMKCTVVTQTFRMKLLNLKALTDFNSRYQYPIYVYNVTVRGHRLKINYIEKLTVHYKTIILHKKTVPKGAKQNYIFLQQF